MRHVAIWASRIAYDKFGKRLSMTNGNGVVTTCGYTAHSATH
jgi:hypothetical protein